VVLSKLNGWQRIWFVLTALGTVFFIVIYPLKISGEARSSSFSYRMSINSDFSNPSCTSYTNDPLNKLVEPPFRENGGSCWHIFTYRRYHEKDIILPFTKIQYDKLEDAEWWKTFFTVMAIGAVSFWAFSALIYGSGKIVGWIIAGFQKSKTATELPR
jgi:hypothetical protein